MPRIAFTRRLFLLLTGAGVLGALPLARWLGQRREPLQVLQKGLRPTLRQCLDTLLPADALTPAATELDLDTELLATLARLPARHSRLCLQGLEWCERSAREAYGRDFALLDTAECDAILQQAAEAPVQSMPARFIQRLRDQAFELYYAHPEALTGMAGAGPPQPMGYPRYAEPPGEA